MKAVELNGVETVLMEFSAVESHTFIPWRMFNEASKNISILTGGKTLRCSEYIKRG